MFPSLLAADFACLGEEVSQLSEAQGLHFDVMDGHFVPNLSFGASILKDLRKVTNLPFDVHLMISCLDPILASFFQPQVSCITLHAEIPNVGQYLQKIKDAGISCGLSLNPHTLVDEKCINLVHSYCDQVLMMSVQAGFGGQSFMPEILPKIASIKAATQACVIVDGGINLETARLCYQQGADGVVAGTWIFHDSNRKLYNMRIEQLQTNI